MDDYIAMSFPKLLSPITHLHGERTLEMLVKDIPAGNKWQGRRMNFCPSQKNDKANKYEFTWTEGPHGVLLLPLGLPNNSSSFLQILHRPPPFPPGTAPTWGVDVDKPQPIPASPLLQSSKSLQGLDSCSLGCCVTFWSVPSPSPVTPSGTSLLAAVTSSCPQPWGFLRSPDPEVADDPLRSGSGGD